MFSTKWRTSERRYGIVHEADVRIPVSAGFDIVGHVFRPDAPGRFPAILGASPYSIEDNIRPLLPAGMTAARAHMEAGDYHFFVRRGYAHVIVNIRGSGKSGGEWEYLERGTIQDLYEVVEWLANQPWCDGNIATFGASYFATTGKKLALMKPPHLRAIFAPFGKLDSYRQQYYNGGIFNKEFVLFWIRSLDNARIKYNPRRELGERFEAKIQELLADPEIRIHPEFVEALRNPDEGVNPYIVHCLIHNLDDDWWREVLIDVHHGDTTTPAYFGGCWGMSVMHLPGDIEGYEVWQGPKKLTIGPPFYLDRPVYQFQYESLRWFDHWLKGVDTGIMDEPPIHLFIQNTGEWRAAEEWPLPETKWTEFFLHNDGLLSEHELWPHDGVSTFTDWAEQPGQVEFVTPPLVENTEVVGPLVLNLYASTTDTEVLWFVHFFERRDDGSERILGRGWLRGSQRRLDPERSKPWLPYHTHDRREPLTPGEVYEFRIPVTPTAVLVKAGSQFGVRIKCTDRGETVRNFVDRHGIGRTWRAGPAQVTVYHTPEYPSHLLVPITRGNRVGTYFSGGEKMVR